MGDVSAQNRLNELSAQEWLKFTKTWFIHNPPPRKKNEMLHPAKYPEGMIKEFLSFFTKEGQVVFDPFLGTGSTLVACYQTKRNGIGIELQKKYANIAQTRVKGLDSQEREEEGLDVKYSDDSVDLGNAQSYEEFLQRLVDIFIKIKPRIKEGGYLVVILQNYMDKGNYKTLAWDFAKEMTKHYQLRGERIWMQDNKTLYPYGYRYSFVPNVHHHYCLVFKKIGIKKNDQN